jgi:hypothetical protein
MSINVAVFLLFHNDTFSKDRIRKAIISIELGEEDDADAEEMNCLFGPEKYCPIHALTIPCHEDTVAYCWDEEYNLDFKLDGDRFYHIAGVVSTFTRGQKYSRADFDFDCSRNIIGIFLRYGEYVDASFNDFCEKLKDVTGAMAWCIRYGDSLIAPSTDSFEVIDDALVHNVSSWDPDTLAPVLVTLQGPIRCGHQVPSRSLRCNYTKK